MSILSEILSDLMALIMPRRCIVCGEELVDGECDICTTCRYMAPLTGYEGDAANPLSRRFWGVVPVERASSLIFFVHGSKFQQLIHNFKYRNRWRSALVMGRWLGESLRRAGLYADVDVVVPVPLHAIRLLRRGYNQSDYVARGVAEAMGLKVDSRALSRSRNNPSQTRLAERDKRDNVRNLFVVRHAEQLAGKHILLVDDVITSGETITACIEALVERVPDVRISVASVACSYNKYGR